MCRGDWKTHGSHTGGFYSCEPLSPSSNFDRTDLCEGKSGNKYDSSEAKKIDDWAGKFLEDSKKFMHYFERYFNHTTARRQLDDRSAELRQEAQAYGVKVCRNYDAIGEAIDLLLEARDVLRFTYVYGFFLEDKKVKPFFEYLQANAEGIVERLSDLVSKSIADLDLDDLKNRIRITKRFITNLVRGIEEGLVPS